MNEQFLHFHGQSLGDSPRCSPTPQSCSDPGCFSSRRMVARGEISRFWSLESLHLGTCAKCELHICLCYRLPVSLLAAHSASSPLLLIRYKCVCVCVSSLDPSGVLSAVLGVDTVKQRSWVWLWHSLWCEGENSRTRAWTLLL